MDIKDIKHLAELSQLEYSEEEMQALSKDFESLVELADIVKNAQIKGNRKFLTIDMKDLREDVEVPSSDVDVILQNAPVKANNCFVVPRIME